MMNFCSSTSEEVLKKNIEEFERIENLDYPNCEYFEGVKRIFETALSSKFCEVSKMALDLSEAEAVWQKMLECCDSALLHLNNLKEAYPYCGGPEIYDYTLDVRNISADRLKEAREEIQCQTSPILLRLLASAA